VGELGLPEHSSCRSLSEGATPWRPDTTEELCPTPGVTVVVSDSDTEVRTYPGRLGDELNTIGFC